MDTSPPGGILSLREAYIPALLCLLFPLRDSLLLYLLSNTSVPAPLQNSQFFRIKEIFHRSVKCRSFCSVEIPTPRGRKCPPPKVGWVNTQPAGYSVGLVVSCLGIIDWKLGSVRATKLEPFITHLPAHRATCQFTFITNFEQQNRTICFMIPPIYQCLFPRCIAHS